MTSIDAFSNSGSAIMRREAATETSQIERILWLQSLFGETASDTDMAPLAGRMNEFFIPKGSLLYEAGSASNSLFFIVAGVIKQGEKGHTHYVATEVVGFVDAMIDRPHLHSAEVIEDAVILSLKIDDWLEHLEDNSDVLRKLIIGSLRNSQVKPDLPPSDDDFSHSLASSDHEENEKNESARFVRRMVAMKASALFRKASIQAIARLVRMSRRVTLSKGEILSPTKVQPGIWIVVTGKVRTTFLFHEEARTTICPPGALLCGVHALQDLPDGFHVDAIEPSELLQLSAEDYFDAIEDHFDVARSTLAYVASRVEMMNESHEPPQRESRSNPQERRAAQ